MNEYEITLRSIYVHASSAEEAMDNAIEEILSGQLEIESVELVGWGDYEFDADDDEEYY